jgi:hydroxymethyl cephem carbamoyltransferase
MLHFSRVISDAIPAVTHVDGTARVQSVGPRDDAALRSLLLAFRAQTGHGVLCNTSLNFQGAGFINRASDLFAYCEAQGVDEVVVEDRWYTRRGGET